MNLLIEKGETNARNRIRLISCRNYRKSTLSDAQTFVDVGRAGRTLALKRVSGPSRSEP